MDVRRGDRVTAELRRPIEDYYVTLERAARALRNTHITISNAAWVGYVVYDSFVSSRVFYTVADGARAHIVLLKKDGSS